MRDDDGDGHDELRLVNDLSDVATARKWARGVIASSGRACEGIVVGDLELLVSELVTNAMRAGASVIVLRLSTSHATVRIAVDDNAPGTPRCETAAPESVGGRGLAIVDQVAQDWGVVPRPVGKEVWALLGAGPFGVAC